MVPGLFCYLLSHNGNSCFAIFIVICPGLSLFWFNMFGALCASCILILLSFRFGKFSVIISSNTLLIPFSLSSPSGIPIMPRLTCFILSNRSLILLSFGFHLAVLIGWFPLFCPPNCLFILLHYLFCCSLPLVQLSSLQVNFLNFCIIHSAVHCL